MTRFRQLQAALRDRSQAGLLRLERACLASAAALAALLYLLSYWRDPRRPRAPSLDQGWWTFSDQGRYLRSTLAWAAGNLDPAEHWYLPGYPLLGVPFLRITPANPFLVPDLLLFLASLWLMGALAARLAPAWRWARVAGVVTFLVAAAVHPLALNTWVTPWTSTPQTPLVLLCLLATLRFMDDARAWRAVLLAALCAAGIASVRPADAVVVAAVCGGAMLLRMATAWPGWGAVLRNAGGALLGGVPLVAGVAALHVLTHGWHLGDYLSYSAYLGFEWRLLPLQWVVLVLDPRPLLPEGRGLVSYFPWIVPGLAGIAACLATPPLGGSRARHLLVAGLAVAHVVQYLAYRDLHPQGLWRYYNHHYFKWVLPVFGLYAVLLCAVAAQRRWAGLAAGAVALALLLPWRAQVEPRPGPALPPQEGGTVQIPGGLGVQDALLLPAGGTFETIYHGTHNYYFGADDRIWYGATGRIAAYPVPGGIMLAPLLPLPAEPGKVVFEAGTTARGDASPRLVRQAIVFGIPCFLPDRVWRPAACAPAHPIPPPAVPVGQEVPLDTAADRMLLPVWSDPEGEDGRWTIGRTAGLRVAAPGTASAVRLAIRPFAPPGRLPLVVTPVVNGVAQAPWTFTRDAAVEVRLPLPAGLVGPDGVLHLELHIADPRAPGGPDRRALGVKVRSLFVEP